MERIGGKRHARTDEPTAASVAGEWMKRDSQISSKRPSPRSDWPDEAPVPKNTAQSTKKKESRKVASAVVDAWRRRQ